MAQTTTAAAYVFSSLRLSIATDVGGIRSNIPARALLQNHSSKPPFLVCSSFAPGSSVVVRRSSSRRKSGCKAASVCIRCEQSTKESGPGLDVWAGRLAMVGFVAAVSVEVVTGKGLLESECPSSSSTLFTYFAYSNFLSPCNFHMFG